MSCNDYSTYWEFLSNGQFFDAVTCPYFDQMGIPLTSMIAFAAIGLGLYVYSGSMALPLAVAILVGAALLAVVPGIGVNLVGIALVLGLAVAGFILVRRLIRNT